MNSIREPKDFSEYAEDGDRYTFVGKVRLGVPS
jgi:hypothetical protein